MFLLLFFFFLCAHILTDYITTKKQNHNRRMCTAWRLAFQRDIICAVEKKINGNTNRILHIHRHTSSTTSRISNEYTKRTTFYQTCAVENCSKKMNSTSRSMSFVSSVVQYICYWRVGDPTTETSKWNRPATAHSNRKQNTRILNERTVSVQHSWTLEMLLWKHTRSTPVFARLNALIWCQTIMSY